MNKHGFIGVRKRTDANRRKPYYARVSITCDQFIYSKDFETAEAAAAEFEMLRASALSSQDQGGKA